MEIICIKMHRTGGHTMSVIHPDTNLNNLIFFVGNLLSRSKVQYKF